MKISIITVCYNSEETLERTIQSVVAQNYVELEYIIIDGGSTDGTLDIIEKYSSNITFWISEPDDGIYDAMNKGLKICTGEIIAFLNSDDWYDRNVLNRVNSYFTENRVDIVSGKIYVVCGEIIKKDIVVREDAEEVFFNVIYPHPALFVKKKLFEKIGWYNTAYKIAADTDWIMRAHADGAKILKVNDYFTYFRDGGLSSRNIYESQKEQYKAALDCAQMHGKLELIERIEEHYEQILEHIRRNIKIKDAISNHITRVKKQFDLEKHYYIWGAGMRGKRCLEILEQLKISVDRFIDNSDEVTVDGYLVISPNEIDTKHIVCVTPKGHEKEIQEQLLRMGVPVCNILFFTELLERVALFGKLPEEVGDILTAGERK